MLWSQINKVQVQNFSKTKKSIRCYGGKLLMVRDKVMSVASSNKTNKRKLLIQMIQNDCACSITHFNLRTLEKNVSISFLFIKKNQIFTIMEPSKIK